MSAISVSSVCEQCEKEEAAVEEEEEEQGASGV